MQADENSAATTEADLTLEEDQWLRISKLEAQLRAKEQDVELAATIGQDLLSQVTALNARVAELEALKQAAPSPTATAAEEEYTPNKREHDTTIQKSSKIPLARVSARRPSSAQHYHNTPSNNATTTPKEQVSYTPAAATTQSQSSHQQPFAPMARTSTIDKTLAEHIENALVLQLRSLQLKMTSVETQRLQLMEKCDSLDQNRALLKNQNEKLAASEKKLNEKIWDLEILNQQLKETNETLQKEITRHLQKIRTCEKELSNVKKYNEVMRRAEAAWTKEKQGILFKMESESNRKRREIANLRREKDSLEKQVEDLNKASAATLTGGAPDRLRLKTSPSKTATRSDSFVGKLETLFEAGSNGGNSTKNLYEEFLAQQQQQLDTQAANNELFLNSLSKALSRAHAQNEELRRENAGLHLDTQELNRLLVEANETIESLKLGFNLSSLEKFEGFDPSFQLESSFFQTENSMSLHDQMVLSESFHDLSYFNAEESFMLPGSKSLLAELQSESPKEMSPPSANINFLAELESETAPLQEKVSLRKVLENSSSETLNAHDIYDDNIGLESIGEIDFSPIEKDGFGPAKNIEFTSVMDSDDLGPTEEIDFAPGIDLTQDIIFVPAEVDTLSFEQNEKIDFAPIKRVNFDLTETVEFEPNETSFKSNSSVEKEHVSKTETADFSCQTDTQSVDPKSILSEFSQSNFVGGLESGVFEAEDGTGIPEVSSSFEGDISFSGSLGLSFIGWLSFCYHNPV
ncbi:hypothetical protein HK100_007575 [Physocladia obscura]|uniref:Uncharacterized protein n=1 Tax=Physocladia obscura TaxID=109957 RepID=A0AAD5XAQ4_9FUNG|nr:hypothetical protein HK100_007575 [Physocladia obscura]